MRRGRTLIIILLILIIGLVVGFFVVRQILSTVNPPQQPANVNVNVYYATQNIPQGSPITKDVIGTMQIPQLSVAAVMYTDSNVSDLLNNKVAKYPLDQGVIITSSMVNDKSAAVSIPGPRWASLIPPGMTAISIPTSRLALSSYAVSSGSHVNINACFLFVDIDPTFQSITPNLTATVKGTGFVANQLANLTLEIGATGGPAGRLELDPSLQMPYYLLPSEAQRPRMVCQTLLQDVVVMRLGNFPLDNPELDITKPAAAAAASTDPNAQPQPTVAPDVVTLIVSPQDSLTLSYLIYTDAKISMALRNPTDLARQPTEASTLQFLLSQYNIPIPAKLPYSMEPSMGKLNPNSSSLLQPQFPADPSTSTTVPPK